MNTPSSLPLGVFSDMIRHFIERCPSCSAKQPVEEVDIISDDKKIILARMSCRVCRSGMLARFTAMPQGFMASVMVTELSADEVIKIKSTPPVGIDDVLSSHLLDLKKLRSSDSSPPQG